MPKKFIGLTQGLLTKFLRDFQDWSCMEGKQQLVESES